MVRPVYKSHSSHWGAFRAALDGDRLDIRPFEADSSPAPFLANIPDALDHPARLSRPMVRRGWLTDGPGPDARRGRDDYVDMPWDEALDLAGSELRRLGALAELPENGPYPGAQVFGGSYGWSSAGRFHHAQSQVHRFLNVAFGGYVASVDTYSSAAGKVILDLVCYDADRFIREGQHWQQIRNDTELVIAFGGIPLKNLFVNPGGASSHTSRDDLQAAARRGCDFVSISPIDDDFPGNLTNVTRLAPRPGTDTAMMLGLAYHMDDRGLTDEVYLDRYTHGWPEFRRYLRGETDGIPKTPEWAAGICGLRAGTIVDLAEQMARKRTHIAVSFALQRAENGEQPVWMGLVLASMLGQSPLSGGGYSYGIASGAGLGRPPLTIPLPTLPQGMNRVRDFIPVAAISDLLLKPGQTYTYKGETRSFAEIRLVYWAGGNPFHHHQDLRRLSEAFSRPETVIVHDNVGTATAAHADIVFPATITAEREDIGAGAADPYLIPMQRLSTPSGEARDDYEIFAALAERLGCADRFTEGRSSREWLEHLYERSRVSLEKAGGTAPDFASFISGDPLDLPVSAQLGRLGDFHAEPDRFPLPTPSGKIEIYSDIVASSGLPGHPAWIEPTEWLGGPLAKRHPFQLVANQPAGRLHSQLDFGTASMRSKHDGREVARLNTEDAERLGIRHGDTLRVWNDRGGFLCSAAPTSKIAASVIQVPTGAWYAPVDLPGAGVTCVNGNPNAVTTDVGASPLSHGCTGQLSLVSVEKWTGDVPPVVLHEEILPRPGVRRTQMKSNRGI